MESINKDGKHQISHWHVIDAMVKIPTCECLSKISDKNAEYASDPSQYSNGKETKGYSKEPAYANFAANKKICVKYALLTFNLVYQWTSETNAVGKTVVN